MKPHKWAKEIKAWADGEEIERCNPRAGIEWEPFNGHWAAGAGWEYRIKPQEQQRSCCCNQTCSVPKEPQYLYVYEDIGGINITSDKNYATKDMEYIGKIKLEQ